MIKLLLEKEADVSARIDDRDLVSAFSLATRSGHFSLVLLFLKAGADINARGFITETALETTAWYGHLDVLYLLLKVEADMHLSIEKKYDIAAEKARLHDRIVIAKILEEWNQTEGDSDDQECWVQKSNGKKRVVELDWWQR